MGAHLHRTLKFLPSATCRRDRLLPMASTRVTMSEPKPGGGSGQAQGEAAGVGGVGIWWMVGGWVSGRPHHYPPDPGSSLRQRRTLSLESPERRRSAAEGGRWNALRPTGHRWGGSGQQRPSASASQPQPHSRRVGPLPALVSGPGAHLTSAEVQVQVVHVRVERKAFQKRPGRECHRGWRELGTGALERE